MNTVMAGNGCSSQPQTAYPSMLSGSATPSGNYQQFSAGSISQVPQQTQVPLSDYQQQAMNAESMQYMNGFLRMQIGSRITAEFLIGTNTYLEKSGKLLAVGANYIVLQEAMTDDILVCDFFNIKFVTIYR